MIDYIIQMRKMIFKPAQPISGKNRFFICWLNPNSFSFPCHHLSCEKLTLFVQEWERKDWKFKPHNISITITEEKLYAGEQQRQHSKRNGLIKDQHVTMKRKSESKYICIWPGYICMNNRYWGQQIRKSQETTEFHLEYRAGYWARTWKSGPS